MAGRAANASCRYIMVKLSFHTLGGVHRLGLSFSILPLHYRTIVMWVYRCIMQLELLFLGPEGPPRPSFHSLRAGTEQITSGGRLPLTVQLCRWGAAGLPVLSFFKPDSILPSKMLVRYQNNVLRSSFIVRYYRLSERFQIQIPMTERARDGVR